MAEQNESCRARCDARLSDEKNTTPVAKSVECLIITQTTTSRYPQAKVQSVDYFQWIPNCNIYNFIVNTQISLFYAPLLFICATRVFSLSFYPRKQRPFLSSEF